MATEPILEYGRTPFPGERLVQPTPFALATAMLLLGFLGSFAVASAETKTRGTSHVLPFVLSAAAAACGALTIVVGLWRRRLAPPFLIIAVLGLITPVAFAVLRPGLLARQSNRVTCPERLVRVGAALALYSR